MCDNKLVTTHFFMQRGIDESMPSELHTILNRHINSKSEMLVGVCTFSQ